MALATGNLNLKVTGNATPDSEKRHENEDRADPALTEWHPAPAGSDKPENLNLNVTTLPAGERLETSPSNLNNNGIPAEIYLGPTDRDHEIHKAACQWATTVPSPREVSSS